MKIGTIASHSALNIMAGAKAEGIETILVSTPDRVEFYDSYGLGSSIIEVSSWDEVLDLQLEDTIWIPHGSFVAYIGAERIINSDLRMYGNRQLLKWEEDRELKMKLLSESGLKIPREFQSVEEIDSPVMVKTYGAAGGEGYFIAKNKQEVLQKAPSDKKFSIQEYVVGTKVFVTYFNSYAMNRLEVFGADIRYETDADANLRFDDTPSFVVVGNLPLVLRESILLKYYELGKKFVNGFKSLAGQNIPGSFCIETIIDKNLNIIAFEFSGRIVAGTNVWIPSSPYSYLQFNEPMWMGRRIARELKQLEEMGRLEESLL
ncbi:MAG: formate--phosphoribosylaminoimidazolecarboxamide ligase [Candidatus Thorarchaeota archaeon]|nr:formate--phosphoribosylaminoimidazolecarboxamide ligase [Candidatus Thorarchaeota archaeon]